LRLKSAKARCLLGYGKRRGMIALRCPQCFVLLQRRGNRRAGIKAGVKIAVNNSFNNITVDGCMSTNDTVFILANGLSGNDCIGLNCKEFDVFSEALTAVCLKMAEKIVRDGEGRENL